MILFPAIDLKEGQCVRLRKGAMEEATIYGEEPGEQARAFMEMGFPWLHVVDLDGAVSGRSANTEAVESILWCLGGDMKVQLGGGLRDREQVEAWLEKGVERVILGTAAVKHPEFAEEVARANPGKVAIGIDARDGLVAVEGWLETSEVTALDLARRFEDAGIAAIIYTDIDRDGVLAGVNWEQTLTLADAVSVPVIASGGVASMADIDRLLRPDAARLEGVIAGRAIYDGRLDPKAALAKLGGGAVTLKVRVIPCLDVKDGRVVKGVNFVDLVDAGDPVEAAKAYDAAGADELCFLDITASHEGRGTLYDMVARTAEQCFMPVTVGGGVRSVDDIRALLLAGADKVAINTAAVADRALVARAADKFGDQCIVVAVDAKHVKDNAGGEARWEIFTHGGRRPTGLDAVAYAREVVGLGAGEILLTSMDRDGTKSGFDLALTRAVADAVRVPVVASGGVGTLEHLVAGVRDGHASAVLAASIFHFGTHTIAEAKAVLAEAGIPVRRVSD